MKHIKTFKLFESVGDDIHSDLIKAKDEYDNKISQIKKKYLEEVSQCMFDLTDEFDHSSSVKIEDGNIFSKFNFDVNPDRVDEFFNIIEDLQDLVKSYISEDKRFIISNAEFKSKVHDTHFGNTITTLHRLPNEINDVKVKIIKEIERLSNRNLGKILITLLI